MVCLRTDEGDVEAIAAVKMLVLTILANWLVFVAFPSSFAAGETASTNSSLRWHHGTLSKEHGSKRMDAKMKKVSGASELRVWVGPASSGKAPSLVTATAVEGFQLVPHDAFSA